MTACPQPFLPVYATAEELLAGIDEAWPWIHQRYGRIWWVNSDGGVDDLFHGMTRDEPFDTLRYALTRIQPGDTIFIDRGHLENIGASDLEVSSSLGLTNANVLIAGPVVDWSAMPHIRQTENDAGFRVLAGGVRFYGIRFSRNAATDSGIVPLVSCPNTSGVSGVEFIECQFNLEMSSDTAAATALSSSIPYTQIAGCRFTNLTTVPATLLVFPSTTPIASFSVVRDNLFHNSDSDDSRCIYLQGAALSSVLILRNSVYANVDPSTPQAQIEAVSGATGIIAYNSLTHKTGESLANWLKPGNCAAIQNFCTDTFTESGALVPAA